MGLSFREIGCGTLAHEGLMPVVSEGKHLGGPHERDHVIRRVAIGCQRRKLRVSASVPQKYDSGNKSVLFFF